MNSIILSVLGKIGLFLLSTVLGMLGYLVFQGNLLTKGSDEDAGAVVQDLIPHEVMNFNAEPVLLAETDKPVDISTDAQGISYVLQRNGTIVRIARESLNKDLTTNDYAHLENKASDHNLGFTALAFHPEFLVEDTAGYGKFYVVTTEVSGSGKADFLPEFGADEETHQDVLYEFTAKDPFSPNFEGDRRQILRFSQHGREHNVSSLAFDHYGYLYIGVGDGAIEEVGKKSASKNASSLTSAFGKVLRIDPLGFNSENGQYGIPETNPFRLVTDSLPEIWAFGLRAPYSLAYDPFQQRLCIGELGQDGKERVHLSHIGGEHFGWDLEASNSLINLAFRSQLADIITRPLLTLDSTKGVIGSATGSLIYRGESFPSLSGKVIVASQDGQLMAASPHSDTSRKLSVLEEIEISDHHVKALRASSSGELIVVCEDGSIFELRKRTALGEGRKKTRKLYCSISEVPVFQG